MTGELGGHSRLPINSLQFVEIQSSPLYHVSRRSVVLGNETSGGRRVLYSLISLVTFVH